MRYVCAVYIGWMVTMILIGVTGDVLRSPALLSVAAAFALAMPLMVLIVSIALIIIALSGKGDPWS
jgi:hypothetical protein